MSTALQSACDGILAAAIEGDPRVPGVVAMATDRAANIYEGAAGERLLGGGAAMTSVVTDKGAVRTGRGGGLVRAVDAVAVVVVDVGGWEDDGDCRVIAQHAAMLNRA